MRLDVHLYYGWWPALLTDENASSSDGGWTVVFEGNSYGPAHLLPNGAPPYVSPSEPHPSSEARIVEDWNSRVMRHKRSHLPISPFKLNVQSSPTGWHVCREFIIPENSPTDYLGNLWGPRDNAKAYASEADAHGAATFLDNEGLTLFFEREDERPRETAALGIPFVITLLVWVACFDHPDAGALLAWIVSLTTIWVSIVSASIKVHWPIPFCVTIVLLLRPWLPTPPDEGTCFLALVTQGTAAFTIKHRGMTPPVAAVAAFLRRAMSSLKRRA